MKVNRAALLLVLFAVAVSSRAADAPPPVKGTLCFSRDCRAVEGTSIAIPPNDEVRPFIWTSNDGKTLVAGTAPSKAASIDVAAKELRTITLSLRGSAARGWPAETTVSIKPQPRGAEWQAAIPPKLVESLSTIRTPRGAYVLAISAPRHQTEQRRLQGDRDLALRQITLRPSPMVSGRTVARDEKGKDVPVAANLLADNGKLAGSSNEQGAFHIELADPLPERLIVAHPGFGTKIVVLPQPLAAENDLGVLQLAAGHKLTLHVALPEGLDPKRVHVEAYADTPRSFRTTALGNRALTANESDVVFPDVSPGRYFVVVTGSDPLEHLIDSVTVEEKDAEKTISILPFRLQGTAKIGDKPLQQGIVGMNDRNGWRAEMPIDQGQFGGILWQHGPVSAWLKTSDIIQPITSPELGANPSVWDIALRDRHISGRIYDAETKQPIDGAKLQFQRTTKSLHGYFPGQVNADGSYSLLAVDNGTYELRVEAPGHLNDYAKFELAETDDASLTHDFALGTGVKTTLEVVTPSGAPIAGANVMEGVNSDGHNPDRIYSTGPDGRQTIQLRPDETRTLYVVPREGSFAIAHVTAPRDDKPVQVVVPAPVGALHIAIANQPEKEWARLVIRYNGQMMPQPLSQRLQYRRPSPKEAIITGLPAGVYEIWAVLVPSPVGDPALIGYVPPGAPVRVGLSAGEMAVEVAAQAR